MQHGSDRRGALGAPRIAPRTGAPRIGAPRIGAGALVVWVASFGAACGGGGSTPGMSDASMDVRSGDALLGRFDAQGDAADVDAGRDATPPDAGTTDLGRPCSTDGDCASGYCIPGPDGTVCSVACDSTADCGGSGWVCDALVDGSGSICFPGSANVCTTCASDAECGVPGDACIALSDGTFCSRSCELRACPSGTACEETTDAAGTTAMQCVPEGNACTGCADGDADGYGIGDECAGSDCDDSEATVHDGAAEMCDGLDNDCDGTADAIAEDCYTGPAGTEGAGTCVAGTRTCTDGTWGECTGEVTPEAESCDGLDNDCDGTEDGFSESCYTGPAGTEGVGACMGGNRTCTDGSWTSCSGEVTPVVETCNGADDDCDGTQDDFSRACYSGPADTEGVGMCTAGTETCTSGEWGSCVGEVTPDTETCDGSDNNCDDAIDEGCSCTDGDTQDCYSGPSGTAGTGICATGTQTCSGGSWGTCEGEQTPQTEACNGADDDCDGTEDGFDRSCYTGPAGTEGVGVCTSGTETCTSGSWGGCMGEVTPATETCGNGIDEDCDGADAACCAGTDPGSTVTWTSACLTAATGAEAAIVVDLVDTQGDPITGATVSMTTTAGTLSSVTEGSAGRYWAVLTAPASVGTGVATVTITASDPCTGGTVTVTTRPQLEVRAPFEDTEGGAGGCPADGNLRVRVVEESTGQPIDGAYVMVGGSESTNAYAASYGEAPAAANTAQTDAMGIAVFRDFEAALDGPQIITAGATGRTYLTFAAMDAADVILPLAEVSPSASTGLVTGDLSNLSVGNGDPIELGLMSAGFTLEGLASFNLESLLADDECYMSGHIFVGEMELPSNVYVPMQSYFGDLNEKEFTSAPIPYGTHHLVGVGGSVPAGSALDGITSALRDITFSEIGVVKDHDVSSAGPVRQDIDMATGLNANVDCTFDDVPAVSDVLCVSVGDWTSDGAGRRVGSGDLFLMGLGAEDTDGMALPVTVNGVTTVTAAGDYAGIEYMAAGVALYLDDTKPGIPAGTENGITVVLDRAEANIDGGGGALTFDDFLPIRTLTRTGRDFSLSTVSSTPEPHYVRATYRRDVQETYDVCGSGDGTRHTLHDLWTVYAPGSVDGWTLPTLPAGWPRAMGGDYDGLVDPATTAEDDEVEWTALTVHEGHTSSFTYDRIRLRTFRSGATHASGNGQQY